MDPNFAPVVWPEDRMPPEERDYVECEVCTVRSRVIWGEGNPSAPIVIILDNPGAREDKEGKEFVCGTRVTLQTSLHQVGLKMDDIYLTYLLKCRPLGRYDKDKARAFSKPFLERQIKTIQPQFIVCLGDTVVQNLFADQEAHVKDLRGKWHNLMGLPTIVSYHPLAVRRRPNLMKHFMEDWAMLAQHFGGVSTALPPCPYQ
ncbi:MAG: uracil-DNA glycosylase [Peptococcaceae bacterium]|nr:uracil-DNA glycosylase [Peptococcaceae bacterium]